MQKEDDALFMKAEVGRRKIAVIVSNMEGEYVYETLRGVEKEAYANGMDVYVFNASASTDESIKHNIGEYSIYELVDYSRFDGVVLFANLIQGYSVYNSVIEQIKESGVATISIDAELDEFCSVGGADYQPMKYMVEHLIEHHHFTKINYISGQDFNSDSRERLDAYCDALKEHGIPVEESRIFKGAFTNVHGRESAKKMLETPHMMPEAVVCATDSIAIGVRNVFVEQGIKIPQQVAVVGFDNVFEARNSVPRLTTVVRDQEQMGHEAVRTIIKMINGEHVPKRQDFPGKLILRESCGCHAEDDGDIATLRCKYVETTKQYERFTTNNNMLMEDLSASKNFENFLERFKKYVQTEDMAGFFLCLDERMVANLRNADKGKLTGIFQKEFDFNVKPDTMSAVITFEDGKFGEGWDFPTNQMVPRVPADAEEPYTYTFLPVHFRERRLGYVIMKSNTHIQFSSLFRARVINLANSLESLRKQVHLQSMIEKVDQMYVTDPLTGLYNRFGFDRYTSESFRKCMIQDDSFMILFADLDGLKVINDEFGHENGDVVICTLAHVLQSACCGGEICARIGGDEFVVYAEGYTDADATAFCKRLDKLLEHANIELGKEYAVSASYGYEVIYPDAGDTLEKYVDRADDKMYVNKNKKKKLQGDNVRIVT